jgi:hypothetical protein
MRRHCRVDAFLAADGMFSEKKNGRGDRDREEDSRGGVLKGEEMVIDLFESSHGFAATVSR